MLGHDFSFGKTATNCLVVGQLEGIQQELLIGAAVLRHVAKHRQRGPWSTEAGGQLFGTIDPNNICVVDVAGPYAGDERLRYRYRSNPVAAQRAIDEHSKRGLLYLGEWHTHAEDYPRASGLDNDAMCRLIVNSRLNSNGLLMMIVGRAIGASGLEVWTVSSKAKLQWRLSASTEPMGNCY